MFRQDSGIDPTLAIPDTGLRLRLTLLGHMAVDDAKGRSYLPRTRKTRALLAILAIASPKPVLRLRLAALLWSRRENEQARASLRQSVHELQDTLSPAWSHVFTTDRHHLTLRGEQLDIDALALAQPLTLPQTLDGFDTVLLEDLGGLDPAFDHWLDEERARFARLGRMIGENILAQCHDPASAIDAAEQLLGIDRSHEGAWRTIMRSHAERGDLGAAVAAYDRCRGVLAELSGARPSPETDGLIGLIRGQSGSGWPHAVPPEAAEFMASPQAGYTPPVYAPAPTKPRRERSTLRLRVAPFRMLGGEGDEGLAIGLADEISAGLSRFRWISCVPASLWPTASGGEGENGLAWGGLEADLLLEGTIQRADQRVRIAVRLLDMRTGGEIAWSGRFDRIMTDLLSLQDEVGAAIVAQIDPELMQHEGRRNATRRAHDMTAQDLLLQALPAIYRLERESFIDARRLLDMSLRADPGSPVAHGWLAYWNLLCVGQGWATDPASASAEAARLADRAVMLGPGDARALTLAGHVRGFLGNATEANALHERALALNPNLAIAWCFSGLAHFYMGRHEEALRRIKQAIRLSPSDPHLFFFDMALILPFLMIGDYPNAIAAGRRAIERNPLFSSAYKGYVAALGLMDRGAEARELVDRLLVLEPGFSIEGAVLRSPLTRKEDIARYADGLRRAGLPEAGGVVARRQLALTIEHPGIDLVADAPHNLTHTAE